MIPGLALDVTPPEIAQQVYRIVYEFTGNNDPYYEAKNRANESAMSCYSQMKDNVDYSNEPLQIACKLAIAGNAIDLGAQAEYGSIDSIISDLSNLCAIRLRRHLCSMMNKRSSISSWACASVMIHYF